MSNDVVFLGDTLKLLKQKCHPVCFNDTRWFIMVHPSYLFEHENMKYTFGKFQKNFYSLDYIFIGNAISQMTLSEAKLKAAILGIELWMPPHGRIWSSYLWWNDVKYAKRVI